MKLITFRTLLVAVSTLLLLTATKAFGERDYTLLQVQVVHRHGSRSPLVTYNETLICGYEYLCGHLNKEGQTMLTNVGSFLRRRYTEDEEVVDPTSPFLTLESYNLTVSYTRSTDVLRTLQSADGLLRGLFPDLTAYFPAVHTVDPVMDGFLKSEGVPAVRVMYKYGVEEEHAECWPVLDALVNLSTLQSIAEEVHSQKKCAAEADRMECARSLCDIGLAYQTIATLGTYPLLKEHLDKLCTVSACRNRHYAAYNASDPVRKAQGSYAQPLLEELITNFNRSLGGAKGQFKVVHYSTHESTLHPMVSVLGDTSDFSMMPPFATTYVFELLRRKGASSDSTSVEDYAVRVMRGHPGVTPDTNFAFSWDNFQLRCMGANGKEYNATDNVCPFRDFMRLVDSSKPTHAAGLCYIDPVFLQRMNCPVDAALNTGKLSSDCQLYRQQCPRYACNGDYRLNAVDYGCYPILTAGKSGMHPGAVGGLAFGMFVVGVLLATGASFLYWRRRYRRAFGALFPAPIEEMVPPKVE